MRTSILSGHKFLRTALAALFWLLVWQGLAWLVAWWVGSEVRGALLLPGPVAVGRTLVGLLGTTGFWSATGFSLFGISLGFLAGVTVGSLLALLTWASPLMDALFSPLLRLIRTAPVASFIILLVLWLTRRTVPMVIAGLMVVPILWSSTKTALEQTDRSLLEMAKSYHFSRWTRFRLVYLPAILPQWTAACATAMGFAWKSGIAAEVILHPNPAMGTGLYRARLLLNTEEVLAWTILVILASFLLERLFARGMGRLGRRYGT